MRRPSYLTPLEIESGHGAVAATISEGRGRTAVQDQPRRRVVLSVYLLKPPVKQAPSQNISRFYRVPQLAWFGRTRRKAASTAPQQTAREIVFFASKDRSTSESRVRGNMFRRKVPMYVQFYLRKDRDMWCVQCRCGDDAGSVVAPVLCPPWSTNGTLRSGDRDNILNTCSTRQKPKRGKHTVLFQLGIVERRRCA